MRGLLKHWLFYGLGRDEYTKSMDNVFPRNIHNLRRTNAVVTLLLTGFVLVPLLLEKNLTKAMFYIGTAVAAATIYFFVRFIYHKINNEQKVRKNLVYILICLSYVNVITFGIYLGVWADPGNIAGTFLSILICALLLFNIPAVFYFSLTALSTIVFIVIVSIVKTPAECRIDIPNALFAGIISMIFGWHIIMNRLSLSSIAHRMENERNDFFDQSTIDELTRLKNRRDFMITFQRSLKQHRPDDKYICIAILDIDHFKNYNDFYGHPKGDDCLRKIGGALKDLQNKMNIYAARIGGEEFALIWFERETANAENVASLVSEMIRRLNIPHECSPVAPYVSVSIGVYVVQCSASNDMDRLYNKADEALYIAKKDGRNRAVINFDYKRAELLRETA
jgi:diguanylate cyclase (GGDEF)-like protein